MARSCVLESKWWMLLCAVLSVVASGAVVPVNGQQAFMGTVTSASPTAATFTAGAGLDPTNVNHFPVNQGATFTITCSGAIACHSLTITETTGVGGWGHTAVDPTYAITM